MFWSESLVANTRLLQPVLVFDLDFGSNRNALEWYLARHGWLFQECVSSRAACFWGEAFAAAPGKTTKSPSQNGDFVGEKQVLFDACCRGKIFKFGERLTKQFNRELCTSQVLEFACDASFMQGLGGPGTATTLGGGNLSPSWVAKPFTLSDGAPNIYFLIRAKVS